MVATLAAWLALAGPFVSAAAATTPGTAPGTAAGTVVANVAQLRFTIDGIDGAIASNSVSFVVAERLDVALAAETVAAPTAAGARAVSFIITNLGNGAETFALSTQLTGQGAGASVLAIAADSDDNGLYDPAIDQQVPQSRLLLGPGRRARLFVLVGGGTDPFDVALTATALSGSGLPGTVLGGLGDGGGDAVVGPTGASATATVGQVSARLAGPSLVKSQSVAGPGGGTAPVRGAIVTYRLEATFPRATAAVDIADPIPAGTAYVAGSLRLDGAALTDAADVDPGRVDGDGVGVALGDVTAGVRTISFQVEIL